MTDSRPDPERQDGDSPGDQKHEDGESKLSFASSSLARAGLGKSIAAGLHGEDLTAKGILSALGGVRGILEAFLPGLLYLTLFVVTGDARVSVIAPAVLAILALAFRLVSRQPLVAALSGVLGVVICVVTTLVTGRGEDYFLPGFWINGAWILGLSISLIAGWPLIGFIVGALRGDLTGWRKDRTVLIPARLATTVWLVMFVVRLVVQLPLYFAGEVGWLGVARLVMGVPLFALVILFTWMLFRHVLGAKPADDGT